MPLHYSDEVNGKIYWYEWDYDSDVDMSHLGEFSREISGLTYDLREGILLHSQGTVPVNSDNESYRYFKTQKEADDWLEKYIECPYDGYGASTEMYTNKKGETKCKVILTPDCYWKQAEWGGIGDTRNAYRYFNFEADDVTLNARGIIPESQMKLVRSLFNYLSDWVSGNLQMAVITTGSYNTETGEIETYDTLGGVEFTRERDIADYVFEAMGFSGHQFTADELRNFKDRDMTAQQFFKGYSNDTDDEYEYEDE